LGKNQQLCLKPERHHNNPLPRLDDCFLAIALQHESGNRVVIVQR
jgi:hypothetical protein